MKILSKKCSFEGCRREHHANGLCHSHDMQVRKGKPLSPIIFAKDVPCSHEECDKPSKVKGLCQNHYGIRANLMRKLATAHPCRSCENGTAYNKSALCDECKAAKRDTAILDNAANRKARFQDQKGACEVDGCDRIIAANTIRTGTRASRLCVRHAADAGSKTMDVDSYVKLMSIDACQACGSSDRLVVDHRHDHHDHHAKMCPDCIRGRLCSDCNSALGLLRDSAERVSGLLEYVRGF